MLLVYCNVKANGFTSAPTRCGVPTQLQIPGAGMDVAEKLP